MTKQVKPNLPFEIAELIYRLQEKQPKHASDSIFLLGLDAWIMKLWSTGNKEQINAGNMLLSAIEQAHANAGKWDRLIGFLLALGNSNPDTDHKWINEAVSHVKATWSHPFVLKSIPKAKRRPILDALDTPFFNSHFDHEMFQLRTSSLDAWQTQDREQRTSKRKVAKDPKTMP